MFRVPITVFLLMLSPVILGADDRPTGRNCDLSAPPPTAGEEINHDMVLRVFPRAKDIDASYTGCQVLLLEHQGKWGVVSLTEIVKGDPVRIWSADAKDSYRACRFKNGKVVRGSPDTCPAPQFLLMKSLAPGCVQIIREAVAKHGLGAPRPTECEYQ